jgi:hypothetical protein
MKNKLIHDGVDATLAKQVAQQKQTNDEAAARSSALKDTKAFVENVDLGGGATARLGQHIFHATEGASSLVKQTKQGVDALGQMDLSAGTLETSFVGAAMAAERVAAATDMAAENTARAAKTAADLAFVMKNGIFAPNVMPTGQLGFTADPNLSVAYRGGGIGKNLSINYDYTQLNQTNQALADKAAADTLATYDQAIAKATAERNPAGQLAAYQSELGYVQGLPASTENYQKIASLQNSIDSLTKSTDSNTSATQANSELLSPYYTQDPRTSHIGFRSQGMASGGYVDVPGGSSANDNMLATIPVASGERIYVDPMTGRRGTASGGNLTINISSPVMIAGNASKDDVGRTMFQNNQNLAKQLRSVTQ